MSITKNHHGRDEVPVEGRENGYPAKNWTKDPGQVSTPMESADAANMKLCLELEDVPIKKQCKKKHRPQVKEALRLLKKGKTAGGSGFPDSDIYFDIGYCHYKLGKRRKDAYNAFQICIDAERKFDHQSIELLWLSTMRLFILHVLVS